MTCGLRFAVGVVAIAVVAAADAAHAQVQEERPRLVLQTGGAIGAIRALDFSPDSTRLYSAGMDKQTQVWGIQPATENAPLSALHVQTLRWELARGWLGTIGALTASPTNRQVAFAGYSARGVGYGEIIVYDSAKNDVVAMLPLEGQEGHKQTIASLDFSPNGERMVSVSKDGEIRLWRTGIWRSFQVRPPRKTHAYPQPAVFVRWDIIAAAEPVDEKETQWRIALYQVCGARPSKTVLPTVHNGPIMAIARDPNSDRWASADSTGALYLWQGTTSRLLRKGRTVGDLAFGPDGVLFAACLLDTRRQAVVEMWDLANRQLLDQVATGESDHNFTCAVSPNGEYLACVQVDTHEILLYPLREKGKRLDKPFTGRKALRLGSASRALGYVAFSADDTHRISFGNLAPMKEWKANRYGKNERVFDLDKATLPPTRVEEIQWRQPEDDAGGWTATIDASGLRVQLAEGGQARAAIDLDPTYQGRARCYCWLPGDDGKPWGIAIGTDGQDGVFIYRLAQQGAHTLVRYFRDHNGWVTSVSVSNDKKFLASSSADHTVKVWSLAGSQENDKETSRRAGWGAVFRLEDDGTLAVDQVMPQGIAARRNLKEDDRLKELKVVRDGKVVTITDGKEMLDAIENGRLWETYVFQVERAGQAQPFPVLLVPAWEPLMTLYVDAQNEWALWTPQGYYNASVNGDELFGWQINRGRDKRPDFYRADQFRNDLERPDVMRELLARGDLPSALAAAQVAMPVDVQNHVSELAAETPTISILSPEDDEKLGPNQLVRIRGAIEFPPGRPRGDYSVKAYINGIPVPAPQRQVNGDVETFEWSIAPPDPFNKVRLIVDEDESKDDAKFAFADVYIPAPVKGGKQRLHVLGLAADDYPDPLKLNCAVNDLTSVIESLEANQGELYEIGNVRTLKDQEITRETVQQLIDSFCEEMKDAGAGDLVLVYLAGHGKAFGKDYFFIPPDKSLMRFDRLTLERVGISWTQLRQLASLPCRKVFMLDTCNSGNIVIAEEPADRLKSAVRPLKRAEVMVVSATDAYQDAGEAAELGHGFFTQCLLEGIQGKADGLTNRPKRVAERDGRVDLFELVSFLETEVPKRTGDAQTPKSTPLELFELVFVPLVNYDD